MGTFGGSSSAEDFHHVERRKPVYTCNLRNHASTGALAVQWQASFGIWRCFGGDLEALWKCFGRLFGGLGSALLGLGSPFCSTPGYLNQTVWRRRKKRQKVAREFRDGLCLFSLVAGIFFCGVLGDVGAGRFVE